MVPERELRKPTLMVSPSVSTQLVPPAPPASLPTRLPPQALSNRIDADATQIPLRRRRLNDEGVVLIFRPLTGQCTWKRWPRGTGALDSGCLTLLSRCFGGHRYPLRRRYVRTACVTHE